MTGHDLLAHLRMNVSDEDRERFKGLLMRTLTECGWRDQVIMVCHEVIKESEGSNVNFDTLVSRARHRTPIPDTVKNELFLKIVTHLLTPKDQ